MKNQVQLTSDSESIVSPRRLYDKRFMIYETGRSKMVSLRLRGGKIIQEFTIKAVIT